MISSFSGAIIAICVQLIGECSNELLLEMNEGTRRRRYHATFLVKLIIVLLFPIVWNVSSSYVNYASMLLRIDGRGIVIINSINSLILGLLIMLPCLVFEYHLYSRPISNSIRRRAVIACMLSWVPSFLLYRFGGIIFAMSSFYATVIYTPVLAISFYIILPLLTRESMLQRIPSEHRDLSYGFVKSSVLKGARRESFLTGLLWVGFVFAPFMVVVAYSLWSSDSDLWSLFSQMTVYAGFPWYDLSILDISIEFIANMVLILPIMALLSSIRFLFVRDVFRYQSGRITRSRFASVAILGEILPSAVITLSLLVIVPPGSFIPVLLPIPILPLIGFAYVRFSKIVPVEELLWPDYEHRMWFEKGREPYLPEPPEESITVPIAYLLMSQVRKRLKGSD